MRSDLQAAPDPSFFRGINRRALRGFATAIVCVAAALGIGASAAGAAPKAEPGYGLTGSWATGTVGTLQTLAASPVATDSHGNILLAGAVYQGEGIAIFAPDGTLLTTIPTTNQNVYDLAIDPVDDDLYVSTGVSAAMQVERFISDGAPVPTYTLDPGFSVPAFRLENGRSAGIAVDPTTGDLLVNDPAGHQIIRYDETGTLVETIPLSVAAAAIMAVPDGSIWVVPVNGPDGTTPPLVHLSATGAPLGDVNVHSEFEVVTTQAVDPATGDVVVALHYSFNGIERYRLRRYTPGGALRSEFSIPVQYNGLAIDAGTGNLYAWTGGPTDLLGTPNGGEIVTYVPAVYAGVETPSASNIQPESFHLSTEVDPGEEAGAVPAGSVARFEYSADGGNTWNSTPDQPVAGPETVGADVAGFEPNRTILVRAVAANALATHTSATVKVTTAGIPPKVTTSNATDVTETSAVLNGTINSIGLQTTYHFEYGTSTAYGSRVPASVEAVAGGDYEVKPFARAVKGLQAGTTYHFRLVAENSSGRAEGADQTFTTLTPGALPVRPYEQVTPADKSGASLASHYGFLAKADGNQFLYVTRSSPKGSPVLSYWVSKRGSSDWAPQIPLDPPMAVHGSIVLTNLIGISDDYSHALVASNTALAPGAIEGTNALNVYVENLATGTYQLVGSAPNGEDEFWGTTRQTQFVRAAPDMSWVLFDCGPSLLPGAPFGLQGLRAARYRWSQADGLEVASVLPNGQATFVRGKSEGGGAQRSVSADGSRIYFEGTGGAEEGVFLREPGQPTKAISVSHRPGDPSTPRRAFLEGITEDGRFAFFDSLTSGAPLTEDAPGEEGDLYRYDASNGNLEYLGAKTTVSNQDPLSLSPGVFDEGKIFYFDQNVGGTRQLSVWREGAITTIAPGAFTGAQVPVSPDGMYAAYRDPASHALYRYNVASGENTCVSCLPDGTPVAANLPSSSLASSNRMTRAVTDEGSVFFETSAPLVAADVNGKLDVYAYEDGADHLVSPGNQSFEASIQDISEDGSNVFFNTAQKLVSRDNDESTDLYDARIGGGLAAQNPPPRQECLRDDCKATPNAGPELPFGGSEALTGPGNVTPKKATCGKGKHAVKRKGKTRCVKKKSKKQGKNKTVRGQR